MRALFHHNYDLAKLFLEHGADLSCRGLYNRDRKGDFKASPIEIADKNSDHRTMDFLFEQGIDINARVSLRGIALQTATKDSDYYDVEFLLGRGADPNASVP